MLILLGYAPAFKLSRCAVAAAGRLASAAGIAVADASAAGPAWQLLQQKTHKLAGGFVRELGA